MFREARELLKGLASAYPRFNAWKQSILNGTARPTVMYTKLGWPWWTGRCRNKRTVMNHPAQSNGSDMLRLAVVAAVEEGLKVCAPVHDAVLIASPLERLDEDTARMLAIMVRAGERIAGIPVRANCETRVCWPDRFIPEKGKKTWSLVQEILGELGETKNEQDDFRINRRMYHPGIRN